MLQILDPSPAGHELINHNDQRQNQKKMDQATANMESHEAQQPQDEEDNSDSPDHHVSPRIIITDLKAANVVKVPWLAEGDAIWEISAGVAREVGRASRG